MTTEALKLTAQIVISHASMSELTPKELVDEIKEIYNVLNALESQRGLAGGRRGDCRARTGGGSSQETPDSSG